MSGREVSPLMGLVSESSTFFALPRREKRQGPFQVRVPVSVGVLYVGGLRFTVGRPQRFHRFRSRPGKNMSIAIKQSCNLSTDREGLTFNL